MPKISFMALNDQYKRLAPEPTPINAKIPEWYKEQPSVMQGLTEPIGGSFPLTVKKCQAIFDAMTSGYILKTPCDIFIDTTKEPASIQVPQKLNFIEHILLSSHPADQVSHLPFDHEQYVSNILRIHPLWLVGTEPGYSTLFTAPMHSEVSPITAVSAIVDTDTFYSDGHLSFYLKKGFNGIIKKGTPMVQVIPFKREEWTHEVLNCNEQLLNEQRALVRATFKNGYRTNFWEKKNYK